MLVASTSWWDAAPDAREPIGDFTKQMLDAGLAALALEPCLDEARFPAAVDAIRVAGAPIAAVEAVCPHPSEFAKLAPRPGLFRLCAVDETEWRTAIRLHERMLERQVGAAPLAILSLGAIDLEVDPNAVGATLARRATAVVPALGAARRSVERLARKAEDLGLRLAIVQGSGLAGLPGHQELRAILSEFAGAPLAVWLDARRLRELEAAGVRAAASWLDAFAPALAGIHLDLDAESTLLGQIPPATIRCLVGSPAADRGRLADLIDRIRRTPPATKTRTETPT